MSVMQVPRLIVPELTLGAAVSNNTQERPSKSLPVTTRRIGLGSSAIDIHLILPSAGFMQSCIAYVLVIHSSVPAMSVAELVAYAKQTPGEVNCASAGIGTVPHLACEYLNKVAGTNILHVPYRDVNSATMATVGNVTQMFFGVSTSAKSQIDSNTLRGLAVSTAQRSLLLPDLPTMIESGYPTFDMPGWAACSRRRVRPPTLSKSSIGRCGGRLSGPICRSGSSPSGWNRRRRRPSPTSGHSLRTTLPAGRNSSMQSELTSSKEKHLNNRLLVRIPTNKRIDR